MSEKTKNLWQEIADVFKKIWSYVVGLWNWLRTHSIGKFLGIVITVVASFMLAIEVIVALLLLGDPYQTQELVRVFTGISIFSYVTFFEYYAFMLGGILLDLAFITVLLWFGIWLWCGQNYFAKPKYAWFYVAVIGFVGLLGLTASMFYMTPAIIRLGQEMHRDYHHTHQPLYIPLDQRYEYYYPNQNEFYRAQREATRIQWEIEQKMKQMEEEFDQVWYRY